MLVSAIMITGKCRSRDDLARIAVQCFLDQSYPEKELVVINDGRQSFLRRKDPSVREIRLRKSSTITLGDLRNVGLANARGELVIQWDDDDWHHPRRMEVQVASWEKGAAVLLGEQIRYSFPHRRAFVYRRRSGIEGTILHERLAKLRYPSVVRGEDTQFLAQFRSRRIVEYHEPLYVRFFHRANTWGISHIMRGLGNVPIPDQLQLLPSQILLLNHVLNKYYRVRLNKSDKRMHLRNGQSAVTVW